jgi:Putative rhamnosyl transferase
MEERFELFERYCLPSVLNQSDQNFTWMIYFDHSTREDYLERARRGVAGRSNCVVKLCSLFGSETHQADLAADLDPSRNWLVTTRLDNDDGLQRDFVKKLHDEVRVGMEEALDFPWGIVLANGVPYLSRQKCNAFISLSESMAGMKTVTYVRHKEMSRRYRVRTVSNDPAWLQSVHGSNVGNKVRGWRIRRTEIPAGFEVGPALPIDDKSVAGVLLENVTLGVGRQFRDWLADNVVNPIRHPPWSQKA